MKNLQRNSLPSHVPHSCRLQTRTIPRCFPVVQAMSISESGGCLSLFPIFGSKMATDCQIQCHVGESTAGFVTGFQMGPRLDTLWHQDWSLHVQNQYVRCNLVGVTNPGAQHWNGHDEILGCRAENILLNTEIRAVQVCSGLCLNSEEQVSSSSRRPTLEVDPMFVLISSPCDAHELS